MSREFTEWDSDGRFVLAQARGGAYSAYGDGSFGSGASTTLTASGSAEARTYYKQFLEAQDAARLAQNRYDSLAASLAECVTKGGRIRRKRLLALIAPDGHPLRKIA